MPYVPQFVKTDLSALQGIMDRSQAKYDYNTQRQEQLADTVASMDATRPYDIQKKQEVMKTMAEKVSALDKEFNYDRSSSQYAKALSDHLLTVKSDPYWGFKKKADELAVRRQKLLDEKGSMFHESYDPFDPSMQLTEKNMSAIDKWKPYDLKDFITSGTKAGVGLSKEIKGIVEQGEIAPWLSYYATQTGFTNSDRVREFLTKEPLGQQRLKEAVESVGGTMDDEKLVASTMDAMIASAIGERKYSDYQDLEWVKAQKDAADQPDVPQLTNVGNYPTQRPYGITTMNQAADTQRQIKELTDSARLAKDDKTRAANEQKAAELQLELDRYNEVLNQRVNSPQGKLALETGVGLAEELWGGDPAIDPTQKYQEMVKYFVETSGWDRSNAKANLGALRVLDVVKSGKLLADITYNGPEFILQPKNREKYAAEMQQSLVELYNTWNTSKDPWVDSKFKKAEDMAMSRLNQEQEQEKLNGMSDFMKKQYTMQVVVEEIQKLNEFEKYYKGRGEYQGRGYDYIEGGVKEDLKKGETYVSQRYDFSPSTKKAEIQPVLDFIVRNFGSFDVYDASNKEADVEGTKLSYNDAQKAKTKIQSNDFLAASFGFNRDGDPDLILTGVNESGDPVTYKLRKSGSMTDDLYEQLYTMTQRPEFLDVKVNDINFAAKSYTTEDDYLQWVLKNQMGIKDMTPFEGLEFEKSKKVDEEDPEPEGSVAYFISLPSFKNPDRKDGRWKFGAKSEALITLSQIYSDYLQSKTSK